MADSDDNFFSRWSRRKALVREGLPVAPVPSPAEAPEAPHAPKVPGQGAARTTTLAGLAATGAPPAAVHATALHAAAGEAPAGAAPPPPPPPAPTLADVAQLTTQSDYTRFVARDVAPEVKNAALKKLFSDPQFNVMDGLDIYIDDYGKPDPLPAGMLRQLVQSQALRLFADEDEAEAAKKLSAQPAAASPPALPAHAQPGDADTAAPADASPGADALPAPALPVADTDHPHPTPRDEDTAVQLQPDDDAGRPRAEPGAGEDARRQH